MEITNVVTINAYDDHCNGCKRHGKDVMIGLQDADTRDFVDIRGQAGGGAFSPLRLPKLRLMEIPNVVTINAYDRQCNGCKRYHKDIMIGLQDGNTQDFVDIFLTNDQARNLALQLLSRIGSNTNETVSVTT